MQAAVHTAMHLLSISLIGLCQTPYCIVFQWAFAVLLWEIFTCGGVPYAAVQNNKLIEYIVEDKKRLRIPSMLQEEEAEYL